MLVLSRKLDEGITVRGGCLPPGSTIHFQIVEIRGSRVRVGISAPKELDILRDELVPNAVVTD